MQQCFVSLVTGIVTCFAPWVNPSAKIIHIDPPVHHERTVERAPPAADVVPLPRPRPPQADPAFVAPIDRPHRTIQR